MFYRIIKKSIFFITLFCLFTNVYAYEFVDPNNETGIRNRITEIYNTKQQYEDLVGSYNEKIVYNSSSTSFWWPVAGVEDLEFDDSDPISTYITSPFGERDNPGGSSDKVFHSGLDIGNGGYEAGRINVIAAKSGEVIYPTNSSQISYNDDGYYGNEEDGGGYGNYVKIKHSDGTYTLYAHLAKNSITVMAGDVVEQGQVIAKMGNSGNTTGTHLHFEIRIGADSSNNAVDPSQYINSDNPRPTSSGSGNDFSLSTTILSKEEFISKMNDYCTRSGNSGFCNNFAANAATVYDASLKNNVNPELVVVTAGAEQSWTLSPACQYTNNYWGIGITNGNGCNAGAKYGSLSEGIAGYAYTLAQYEVGGSLADFITSRYEQRSEAGCDPLGHGLPGTLSGMQSVYSWVGDYRYEIGVSPGSGCEFLNYVYGDSYCSTQITCNDVNNCPKGSETTVCEQNDYTAWQLKVKSQIRYDIFGL